MNAAPLADTSLHFPPQLELAPDGSWFVGARGLVRLDRRRVLMRIVKALADHAATSPGSPLPTAELIARTWPGERFLPSSGTNRLYFAICALRDLGLRPYLRHVPGGYLLDRSGRPQVPELTLAAG